MGANRLSYKISDRWKYGGKKFSEKLHSLYTLFMDTILLDNEELFMKDNFIQPFNKKIGCKLSGHKYYKTSINDEYCCSKCFKTISEHQHDNLMRRQKILKIKNKI